METFDDATLLLTGGTGSFGHAFVGTVLTQSRPRKVIVFSRDEMKQWNMAKLFPENGNLRYFIGDVRDKDRLERAMDGVDYVIHAAATKIVPTAEYNPFEAVKTNVIGAMNVIDAAINKGVKKVVALSTDKASSPINLYGATKLASDKLFIAGNSYSGGKETRFSVVRYGNVMGSRGSVIPFFLEQASRGADLTITDERMTRFMISLDQGVDLVATAFQEMKGGEIFVKRIPSMNIMDIAEAISPGKARRVVGIRPGEKLHEQMIGPEDAPHTYDYGDHYRILPAINNWSPAEDLVGVGVKVQENFSYGSDTNSEWMSIEALQDWISRNERVIGAM